jgi:hypothetical protein
MAESTKLIPMPAPLSSPRSSRRGQEAWTRMRYFFSSHIRNPHTRRAYREAVRSPASVPDTASGISSGGSGT